MKQCLLFCLVCFYLPAFSQELFVVTESASNPPAKSVSVKLSGYYFPVSRVYDRSANRLIPEIMIGVTKNWMVSVGTSFSNMHTFRFKKESYSLYTKYRFLSKDEIHRHFRMAAFVQASYTHAPFHYDEVGLMGDKTGVEGGLIATQLLNRFAISASVSHVQGLDKSRYSKTVFIPKRIYEVMNYSISSGLLILPVEYKNYKQLGLNLYFEVLAQQALDKQRYFIDGAPAIQLILFSTTRINAGYRFQLTGNAERMSKTSWLLGVERSFLNVWKKKQKTNLLQHLLRQSPGSVQDQKQ